MVGGLSSAFLPSIKHFPTKNQENPVLFKPFSFQKLYKQINKIFNELRDEFKWGGGEDLDGGLGAGDPDFDKAEKEILEILEILDKK